MAYIGSEHWSYILPRSTLGRSIFLVLDENITVCFRFQSPRISHHHSVLEAETDDDHEGQSFQSPTLPASKPPPTSGSVGESVGESSDEGDNSDENEDDDSENDYENIDENEDEDDEQQTTQIEVFYGFGLTFFLILYSGCNWAISGDYGTFCPS